MFCSARRKDRAIGGGVAAKSKTTRRISDSVAIYLPPNVQDSVGATYNDMQTGMLGYAAAAALDFSGAVGAKDYESAAAALTGGIGGIMTEAAKKSAAALAETLAGAEGGAQLVNRAFGQADKPFMEVLFERMEVRQFTYNKISTCVLTNCTVDYTPGAVRSFADGAPTQITMGLTFKETETLTKDKINEGF